VVRVFEDKDVTHVEGDVDPVRDLEIISDELRFKDIDKLEKDIHEMEGKVKRAGAKGPKELKNEYDVLIKAMEFVKEQKRPIRCCSWTNIEIEFLNKYLFLTAKPLIYLVNMTEEDYKKKKNKWLAKIKAWIDENDEGALLIPFSANLEEKLVSLEAEKGHDAALEYQKQNEIQTALPKIVKQGFSNLQLIYFFTAGADEVKCWNIRKGTMTPQAAGTIHTDFEKGFICAEIMKFEDLKELGSEGAVKAAGKYKQKGRDYVVEDGEIIFFKFNAPTSGGKKK
jgi:obg-like ATPase 1